MSPLPGDAELAEDSVDGSKEDELELDELGIGGSAVHLRPFPGDDELAEDSDEGSKDELELDELERDELELDDELGPFNSFSL
jgi:hypothetical protein